MPSPFPGIDPFIEDQEWSDFHPNFVVQLQAQLAPRIEPRYYVRVERRVYVEHPDYGEAERRDSRVPDVAIVADYGASRAPRAGGSAAVLAVPMECVLPMPQERRESFLKIHATDTREVVTVLEVLSPSNKRRGGDGRREYLKKRDEVLRTVTHLVELDLLRGGERLPINPPVPPGDYYAVVSRCERRPLAEVYAWSLPDPLPIIAVPLLEGDNDVPLDLGAALTAVYDRARYQLSIDYAVQLQSPLPPDRLSWLTQRLGGRVTPR